MDLQTLESAVSHSLAGTAKFPQIVEMLLREGVESYHVDLVRNENRYYHPSGKTAVVPVALGHEAAARAFDAAGVAAAVRNAQTGKSNYPAFVREILRAGCVYYIAYLAGKKVCYFGRDGDVHVEHFPQPK